MLCCIFMLWSYGCRVGWCHGRVSAQLGMSDVMCGRFASIHATVRGRSDRVCQMRCLLLFAVCVCEKMRVGWEGPQVL